jgi:NADP-dependent 3-hydroxy acid dehydrogenase YdfG
MGMSTPSQQLQGKVALITGAGSGMGAETAVLLAEEGAQVVLVGRSEEKLTAVADRITRAGGSPTVAVCDIADGKHVRRMVADVRERLGRIDILVNNAGSSSTVLNPQFTPASEWRAVVDVNLTAVFELTQAVLPDLLESGEGTVVTVSSLAAVNPNLLGGAAYGAAKAGVRNFMTFLHNTFRNEGLRAITVLPGEADTPILENRARPPRPDERANMLQPIDVARAIHLAVVLPPRVVLQEIVVAPTRQRDTTQDLAISRWVGAPDGAPSTESATS